MVPGPHTCAGRLVASQPEGDLGKPHLAWDSPSAPWAAPPGTSTPSSPAKALGGCGRLIKQRACVTLRAL